MGRLSLYYAVAFMALLGFCFTLLYWSVGSVFDNRMDEELGEDVAELSVLLQQSGIDSLIAELDQESAGKEKESLFIHVYDRSASRIYSSDLAHWKGLKPAVEPVRKLLTAPQGTVDADPLYSNIDVAGKDEPVRVIIAPLSNDYILVLGELLEERAEVMEVLLAAFASAFLLALPLAGVLVWLLTRKAIAGIRKVSDAAHSISSGDLDRRVGVTNQVAEVQLLADTFDAMAERIQTLICNMREMTDNIAHDLRSPLGRIRLLAESSMLEAADTSTCQDTAGRTVRECDRLINMINVSLDIAESEAGVARLQITSVDSAALVAGVCEMFEPVAEEKGVKLTCQPAAEMSCTLKGDSTSLQRMLANVIDNAIKFTPQDGSISVTSTHNDGMIELCVTDTGAGIDRADLDAIFNRFFRSDPSRSLSGCGLGLSYSRAVARAHGGDIVAESVKGRSSTFRIVLPDGRQNATVPAFDAEKSQTLTV